MEKSKEKKLWDETGATLDGGKVSFGRHFSYQYKNTPRHILFTLSRYKFAQKMIGNNKRILELGCNEGIGCHYLSEFAKSVCGVDFDEKAIDWAQNNSRNSKLEFICDNFLNKNYGEFDAVVSYDVIEHIYPENENNFVSTVINNLTHTGISIIGTPNLESDKFSNVKSSGGHINLFEGDRLQKLLNTYFHNVFLFSMNDEIIHTGFSQMAHYFVALCVYPKVDHVS